MLSRTAGSGRTAMWNQSGNEAAAAATVQNSMSNKETREPSTSLHLGKFAPGSAPAAEERTGDATISVKIAANETLKQGGQIAMPKDAGELSPQEMLGAVSYCYAKGVYSSEEIETRMLRDPKLREAVHGEVPRAGAIRRFRVLNRDAIRSTLEKAFRFMRKGRSTPPVRVAPPPAHTADEHPSEGTITVVRREADERLDKAAFIDNMTKE
jgi:hypothetical protein